METYQIALLIIAVVLLVIIIILQLIPKKATEDNLLNDLGGRIKEENFLLSKTIIKENSDIKLELANSIIVLPRAIL